MDTLAALPNELLEIVADSLDRSSLLALRFICRGISNAIDNSFAKRCFTTRSHALTKYGMQAFADIASVPRLAKRVRTIEVVNPRVKEYLHTERYALVTAGGARRIQSSDDESDEQDTVQTQEDILRDKEILAQQEQRRVKYEKACKAWRIERIELDEDHQIAQLLTAALSAFHSNGRKYRVAMRCNESGDQAHVYGITYLMRQLGLLNNEVSRLAQYHICGTNMVTNGFLQAVADSGISLQSLARHSEFDGGTSAEAFRLPNRQFDALCDSCASLESLGFSVDNVDGPLGRWSPNTTEHFSELLSCAANLRVLDISTSDFDDVDWAGENVLTCIKDSISSQAINQVTLKGLHALPDQLVALLRRLKGTLANLKLEGVSIPRSESWWPVLSCISSELGLERLDLTSLAKGGGASRMVMIGTGCYSTSSFEGADAIEEGLRTLRKDGRLRYELEE